MHLKLVDIELKTNYEDYDNCVFVGVNIEADGILLVKSKLNSDDICRKTKALF